MNTTGQGPYIGAAELKQRGWTEAMIREFLGEPHRTTPNHGSRSHARIRYWLIDTVTLMEKDEDFQRRRAAADARRAAQQDKLEPR